MSDVNIFYFVDIQRPKCKWVQQCQRIKYSVNLKHQGIVYFIISFNDHFLFLIFFYLFNISDCLKENLLYSYFIALREIYRNVCPEVPGDPFGVGKCNISGIPGNRGTNVLVYFPRSNKITDMLHFHS